MTSVGASEPWLSGKAVVLTGGTSGCGGSLLDGAVASGASHVWLVCRNVARGEAARARVAKLGAASIELVRADLGSMSDVRGAAKAIVDAGRPIDLCFLNAATLPSKTGAAGQTAEGLEEAYATNVCAPHLLTRLLAPAFAPDARIVVTGSDAGGIVKWKVDLDALVSGARAGRGGFTAYCRSKCALHQWASCLQERLPSHPVLTFHPGAVSSGLGNNVAPILAGAVKPLLRLFFRSPATAASIGLYAANSAEALRGYIEDGNMGRPRDFRIKPLPGAQDREANERLWSATEASICKALGIESLPPLCPTSAGV